MSKKATAAALALAGGLGWQAAIASNQMYRAKELAWTNDFIGKGRSICEQNASFLAELSSEEVRFITRCEVRSPDPGDFGPGKVALVILAQINR